MDPKNRNVVGTMEVKAVVKKERKDYNQKGGKNADRKKNDR